jgi:hypothetical protein
VSRGYALCVAAAIAGAAPACGDGIVRDPVSTTVITGGTLDGQRYMVPCGPTSIYSDLMCSHAVDGECPAGDGPYLTRGNITRDDEIVFPGIEGTVYAVRLRVRGIVEPKHYTNGGAGGDPNGTNYALYVGGEPTEAGGSGVFMLGVSSPRNVYFLNAVDVGESHAAYPVDYTFTAHIAAGAHVRFLQSDPDCAMVRNCGDSSLDGTGGAGRCDPITLDSITGGPGGFGSPPGIPQPYDGQFLLLNVVGVDF